MDYDIVNIQTSQNVLACVYDRTATYFKQRIQEKQENLALRNTLLWILRHCAEINLEYELVIHLTIGQYLLLRV